LSSFFANEFLVVPLQIAPGGEARYALSSILPHSSINFNGIIVQLQTTVTRRIAVSLTGKGGRHEIA
jgi:hypothetical protein